MRPLLLILATAVIAAAIGTPVLARPPWEASRIYGGPMMSREERRTYRSEFEALETDAEREAYWRAHVAKMQERALERGVSAPDVPMEIPEDGLDLGYWRPPYFEEIMTDEERSTYRTSLDAIPDRDDRRRFVANHIRKMQARAEERGVSVPSAVEFDDVFEALAELDAAGNSEAAAEPKDDGVEGSLDFEADTGGPDAP